MNEERLKQIGKFLETRMFIHRQVEHNSHWTTEEKMIVELYDSYITLLIEYSVHYKKQKEVINKIKDLLTIKKSRCLNEDDYILNAIDLDEILDILKEVSK